MSLRFNYDSASKDASDAQVKKNAALDKAIARLEAPTNSFERVREFMLAFGHPVLERPTIIEDEAWERMRLDLIVEEVFELMEACGYETRSVEFSMADIDKVDETDIVAVADALGDIEYVVNGMGVGMGIPLPEVVKEIHRSNMTKLGADGKPIYREDGKILKGPNYEPPSLQGVLF